MEKCSYCNKRTMIPIVCHCNMTFCLKHRMPETHACHVDYREKGKLDLSGKLVKLESIKLEKI